MAEGRRWDKSLLVAGVFTSSMAIYHFALPSQFRWGDDLAHEPMLRWALLMINACFSYLLLAGGLLTVMIARRPRPLDPVSAWALAGMLGFWLLNGLRQVLAPMPLPPRLAGLKWFFLAFATLVALLYASGLRPARRPAAAAADRARQHGSGD